MRNSSGNSDLQQIRDKEDGFEEWVKGLDEVTFHAKLGSQGERVERIVALAEELAPIVGADPQKAKRAAQIAKADLQSAMVYEFPEMQGRMGRIYAERAGEDASVALAIEEHYKPLGPTDDVPTDPVSVTVALADKLDTLVGFWAIDEKPTGSKDPFALRRAALGVIRLVVENGVRLPLKTGWHSAWLGVFRQIEGDRTQAIIEAVYAFDGQLRSNTVDDLVATVAADQREFILENATKWASEINSSKKPTSSPSSMTA